MTKFQYSLLLMIASWTTIALFGMMVVMCDFNEKSEPFEYVPVTTK